MLKYKFASSRSFKGRNCKNKYSLMAQHLTDKKSYYFIYKEQKETWISIKVGQEWNKIKKVDFLRWSTFY